MSFKDRLTKLTTRNKEMEGQAVRDFDPEDDPDLLLNSMNAKRLDDNFFENLIEDDSPLLRNERMSGLVKATTE